MTINYRYTEINWVRTAGALVLVPIIIVGLLFLGLGIDNANQSNTVIDEAGANITNATTNITVGEMQSFVQSNSGVQGEDPVTVSDKIVVRDTRKMQVKSNIIAINLKKEISTGILTTADFTDGGELVVDALESKNVSVRLKLKGVDKGEFVLDDFGKNNPESVLLPGRVVKYVEIGTSGISFSSAEITIRYTGADLNGGSENDLTIYHWNGTSWDALPTTVDATNNVLMATTTSLSSFGVATRLINYLENNEAGANITNTTTNITVGEMQSFVQSNSGVQGEDLVTVSDKIVVRDTRKMQVKSNIIAINLKKEISTGILTTADFTDGGELVVDALESKNVSVRLKLKGVDKGEFVLDDFGKNNPESVLLPGRVVKYVEIGTSGISFSSAEITIRYTGADLNGGSENDLTIYHWNGTSWDALPTTVDATNNVLTATTTSLSSFGVATRLINYLENNEAGANITNITTYLSLDELQTKGVAVKLKLNKRGNGPIKIVDHGKKNPLALAPPGNSIKFVDISAADNSFESAEVRIQYTDEELGGGDENALIIYHWDGAVWDALPTMVDAGNNVLTATTTSLSPFAVSGGDAGGTTLIVSVNRFVVLDDPLTTGKTAQTGFALPAFTGWSTNQWSGNQTQIKGYALLLDKNGIPISSTNVTFNISNWNASFTNISNVSTNSNGIAIYTFDMNARNYYGNWTVKATALGKTDSTGFIYNWWGCQAGGCEDHTSRSVGTATPSIQNSPYTLGRETITADSNHNSITDNDCVGCHRGYGGVGGGSTFTGQSTKTADVHVTNTCATCHAVIATHDTNEPIKSCTDCHSWTNLTREYTIKVGSPANMSNYSGMVAATGHDPNNTIPCIICHGPMHNITKPDESLRSNNNNITEDSHCTTCHTSYNKHNSSNATSGGVNCTLCHSQDIHYIQVFAQNSTGGAIYVNATSTSRGNCTLCHQNGSAFFLSLKNASKAGNYIGRSPPQVQTPVRHSNNASNGSRWNSTKPYWNSSNQVTLCKYCHGETNHKSRALGRPSNWSGNNVVNSTIGSTTWCTGCHWQGYSNGSSRYLDMINNVTDDSRNITSSAGYNLSIPPEITGNVTYGAFTSNQSFFNHSDISIKSDNSCYGCHRNGTSAVSITGFMHDLTDVSVRQSGPDCIGCHDYNKTDTDALHRINNSDMKAGAHANINSNATNSSGISADNKKCWGCHTSNGSQPQPYYLNYYNMGDRYANPYECYDCHNSTGKAYNNVSTAPNVSEHFKGGNQIRAASGSQDNSSSCLVCHNLSELKVSYTEDDLSSNSSSLSSHYARNRTDLRTWNASQSVNCSYCHQNSTTVFASAMSDASYNSSIRNHSTGTGSPSCFNSTCHGSGWIHNSTLTRPPFSLPNSTYCTSCHTEKQRHNGSTGLNCTSCHINSSGSDTIHPIKYLQANSSFQTTNTSAVNCTNCHQNTMSGFSTAPRIPTPMNHSTNTYSGAMWNATQSGYFWDNTSQQSSCNYCHGTIAYHNSSGLGNISLIKGTNTVRQSLTGGYWCANCHYNGGTPSGKYNYKGNLFNPVPPEILNLTGSVPAASRDGTGFVNHSGYFSSGFDDNACKICHNNNLNSGATSLNFSHNAGTGIAGGANCTNCHDVGGSAGTGRLINSTAMNNGIHSNLNTGTSSPSGYPSSNFKCWACHGNGSEPGTVHPANYKNPYNCTSCHIQDAGQNLNFTPASILNVSQHYWNGTSITTAAATSCYVCHNLSEMMLGSFDPDGAGSVYAGTNGGNNSTSHYGRKRTDYPIQGTNDYCNSCHNNSSTVFPFIDSNNKSIRNHSVNSAATPLCSNSTCHDSGRIHNSTLNKPSLSLPNSSYCSICHSTKVRHNGTINCTQCHLNTSRSIHPVRYLQNDGSGWNTMNTTAVNCTNCHQTLLANFSSAPQIPGILKHSSDPSAGMKWGNYWNNSSALTACYYCHQSQVHRATGLLGNITSIRGSNTYNNADLANSTWCVNCHYSSASQYNGTILNPVPPEITDSSLNSTDGTAFYNHSNFTGYNDSVCKNCHGAALSGYPETTLNFSHAVSEGGGGPNCISCHDESGTGAPSNKRISSTSMRSAVHKNLNSDALNSTAVDPINKACWACHGDGTEPSGHPLNYTNPRRCSNNDCHSLAQSYKAPMIYSHFKDAELNDNQNRVLNYNVTTVDSCEACHSNSLSAESDNLNASTSHYATKDKLIDSINCLYCHLDKDNAQKWGNAIEVNKNRTALIEMNRDIRSRNKFTAHEGDFVELGMGYRLKVLGVSKQRGSAEIELYHYNTLVDKGLVNIGQYTYEETMTVDNNVFKTPVIILNVSEMFLADNDTFIQFDGWRIKRLHPENKTTSCYLCHYVVGNDRHKYSVIDKVNEKIYFADILFNSSDIQEYDEQQALKILANKTPRDSFTDIERGSRKSMYEGETWDIGKDLRLTLKDISTNSDSALFLLEIGNKTYQDVVRKNGILEYEISVSYPGQKQNNITIFRAKVPEILQNKPNMVVLTEILALSPEIRSVRDNTSIYGYNASWLWENDTFLTGRIPSSLHAPLLHDGIDGGPNCVSCHTGIELGSHKPVNKDSISSVAKENKACWACHGDGKEPLRHPISFKYPRNCKSCHVELDNTFNATRIGDEKHSTLENCARCHVEKTHKVFRFNVVPGIKDLVISKDEIVKGDKVIISATAVAGFNMRIKGAQYYIDTSEKTFSMNAVDGSFDGQVEEIIAEIDTSGLKPGTHLISVRAMELENKWGVESSIYFKVMESEPVLIEPEKVPYLTIVLIGAFIILLLVVLKLVIKKQ